MSSRLAFAEKLPEFSEILTFRRHGRVFIWLSKVRGEMDSTRTLESRESRRGSVEALRQGLRSGAATLPAAFA